MAHTCLRLPAQLTPPTNQIALETQKISDESVSQPNATNSALKAKQEPAKRSAESRKRRNARRKEAQREKKKMAFQTQMLNKMRELLSKVGANMQELDDAKLQQLAKQFRKNIQQHQTEQMAVENNISENVSETRAEIQELLEAEKQKSERFFSLARKYYGMWKTLDDQLKSALKPGKEEPTSHVRILILLSASWSTGDPSVM